MWIGRTLTRDLQNMSGRHHQVETSRIVRCPLLFRLDEFGRVQVHSTHVSSIYRVSLSQPRCRIGTSQCGTAMHVVSGCTPLCPFSFPTQCVWRRCTVNYPPVGYRLGIVSYRIMSYGTPSCGTSCCGMLQGHARSCGYLFSTALSARSSCPSPQLPHGQQMGIPGFPLPLVGTMPVDRFPLAGCSRASWFSKPFEHAGPHFHLSSFCRGSGIPVHRAAYPNSIGCWASLARWSHCLGPTCTGATFWAISSKLADPIYAE